MTDEMDKQIFLDETLELPYCKGCGHQLVTKKLNEALHRTGLKPDQVAFFTDIGCTGLADKYFPTVHTVHTTHGRSTAFAAGTQMASILKIEKNDMNGAPLKSIVLIGDGGASIGLLHITDAAKLNVDITVLVHNNWLYGMTGGQNSAFSPLGFVTTTTPRGQVFPPWDLCKILEGCNATFLARKLATDRDLSDVIASAILHNGFSMVEIFEICPAYGTKLNALTGRELKMMLQRMNIELGIITQKEEPDFGGYYRASFAKNTSPTAQSYITPNFSSSLIKEINIMIAGTAGERVQSSAYIFCNACMNAGLHCTQKNDNPVTQGSGFSMSEIKLSPLPILYTGIEKPDILIIVSQDGYHYLKMRGLLDNTQDSIIFIDTSVNCPDTIKSIRVDFRKKFTGPMAAYAALVYALAACNLFPVDAFYEALRVFKDRREEYHRIAVSAYEQGQTQALM